MVKPIQGRRVLLVLVFLLCVNAASLMAPRADFASAKDFIDEYEASASDNSATAAFAMHIMASHGHVFGPETVERLLAGQDSLLIEFAMTHDFSRGDAAAAQRRWLDARPEHIAATFFLNHQVRRMERADLQDYIDSLPE